MKDKNQSTLGNTLIDSISSDPAKELMIDGAELALDSFLDDGILKDIPFFGTFYKSYKGVLSIREAIFSKKIFKFLTSLGKISEKEKEDFLNKLGSEGNFKSNVGEKIIVLLEQVDDMDKPVILAKLLKACINGKIEYDTFLKLSFIVQRIFLLDLYKLKNVRSYYGDNSLQEQFASLGIMTMKLKDNESERRRRQYALGDSDKLQHKIVPLVEYHLSDIGNLLIKHGLTD